MQTLPADTIRQPANRMQYRCNRSHCSIRSTVERVFGFWGKRFHVLGSDANHLLTTSHINTIEDFPIVIGKH